MAAKKSIAVTDYVGSNSEWHYTAAITPAEFMACALMDATDGVKQGGFISYGKWGWKTINCEEGATEYWIYREFLQALEESHAKENSNSDDVAGDAQHGAQVGEDAA